MQMTAGRTLSVAHRLPHVVYDLVGHVVGLSALPVLPFLALTRHGRGLSERLGRVPATVRALHHPLWVHAASVGEVLAAEPLIQQVRREQPGLPIVVSTTTITGRETARERLAADAVMLLPVDIGWVVGGVLRALRPCALVIVETELWPALIRAAARHGVPCVLVSGRISARSARRYAWIGWLLRATLEDIDAFAMQTEADAARIIALGAPAERVQVIGNLKFARQAAAPAHPAATAGLMDGRSVLVAASTHAGEEQAALDACTELWAEHPELLLLIAPRRPERFAEVEQLLVGAGVRQQRRSRLRGAVDPSTQVLLLDTVGELLDVLPAASAVFVGGTLVPVGGHNVLEPALFGKPVAFGPHLANVEPAAAALVAAAAATPVRDARDLGVEWRRLLAQPAVAAEMGARGQAVVAARAAVAPETFRLLRRYMHEAPAWRA
jgi:3-deoxy-D-manno-octulosonic-acid transferase